MVDQDIVGAYADEGLAEHKARACWVCACACRAAAAAAARPPSPPFPLPPLPKHQGAKHLDPYWHKGMGGIRSEGHNAEEEAERLHEIERVSGVEPRALRLLSEPAPATGTP